MNYSLLSQSSVRTHQSIFIIVLPYDPGWNHPVTCRMVATQACNVVSHVARLGDHPNYSMLRRPGKSSCSTSKLP